MPLPAAVELGGDSLSLAICEVLKHGKVLSEAVEELAPHTGIEAAEPSAINRASLVRWSATLRRCRS